MKLRDLIDRLESLASLHDVDDSYSVCLCTHDKTGDNVVDCIDLVEVGTDGVCTVYLRMSDKVVKLDEEREFKQCIEDPVKMVNRLINEVLEENAIPMAKDEMFHKVMNRSKGHANPSKVKDIIDQFYRIAGELRL